jgi:hypothetical protein
MRDEFPAFEICEQASGTFFVQITEPGHEPRRVGDFTTTTDAARWIRERALDWTRVEGPTSS